MGLGGGMVRHKSKHNPVNRQVSFKTVNQSPIVFFRWMAQTAYEQ